MDKGKLIIYWDYELQKGADASTSNYKDGIEDYYQTQFILSTLKEHNIKTCFAVLGYAALKGKLPYHASEQIRQMAEQGHEVGSHTFNHPRISLLNIQQLSEELKSSKEAIEKVSKSKCTAFVPPWDKPQYLFKYAVDFKPGTILPRISKLDLSQICSVLQKSRYKTYRICPLLSRFNKYQLSEPFLKNKILCIPSRINNGFGIEAKKLVKKAVDEKGLAVVYAHPRGLAHPGPQNKKYFEDFIRCISNYSNNRKLDIILPQELEYTKGD